MLKIGSSKRVPDTYVADTMGENAPRLEVPGGAATMNAHTIALKMRLEREGRWDDVHQLMLSHQLVNVQDSNAPKVKVGTDVVTTLRSKDGKTTQNVMNDTEMVKLLVDAEWTIDGIKYTDILA